MSKIIWLVVAVVIGFFLFATFSYMLAQMQQLNKEVEYYKGCTQEQYQTQDTSCLDKGGRL